MQEKVEKLHRSWTKDRDYLRRRRSALSPTWTRLNSSRRRRDLKLGMCRSLHGRNGMRRVRLSSGAASEGT